MLTKQQIIYNGMRTPQEMLDAADETWYRCPAICAGVSDHTVIKLHCDCNMYAEGEEGPPIVLVSLSMRHVIMPEGKVRYWWGRCEGCGRVYYGDDDPSSTKPRRYGRAV